jgi:hypothetical protein
LISSAGLVENPVYDSLKGVGLLVA